MGGLVSALLEQRMYLRQRLLDFTEALLDRLQIGRRLLLRALFRLGYVTDYCRAVRSLSGKIGHLVFIGHRFTSAWLGEGSGSFAAIPTHILARFEGGEPLLTRGESA